MKVKRETNKKSYPIRLEDVLVMEFPNRHKNSEDMWDEIYEKTVGMDEFKLEVTAPGVGSFVPLDVVLDNITWIKIDKIKGKVTLYAE
jgi:hypothetical protein